MHDKICYNLVLLKHKVYFFDINTLALIICASIFKYNITLT